MRPRVLLLFPLLSLFFLFPWDLSAEVPLEMSHQGRVAVDGKPFTGQGLFRFALVTARDEMLLWSNSKDTAPADGVPDVPVALTVDRGLYAVVLGAVTGMEPLTTEALVPSGLKLRIWFDDGDHGVQRLEPDQPLGSVPYALVARTAETVPNRSITGDKLADPLTLARVQGGQFSGGNFTGGTFAGDGSGLTALNAANLATGTVPDERLGSQIPRLDISQTFTAANTFADHVRIGRETDLAQPIASPGYGPALVLSGGPDVSGDWTSDNSDPLWLARYNVRNNETELRVSIGDDAGATDKLVVGTTSGPGSDFNQVGTWTPKFSVDAAGTVKMGSSNQFFAVGSPSQVRIFGGRVGQLGTVSMGYGFTAERLTQGWYRVNYSENYPGGAIFTATTLFANTSASVAQRGAGYVILTVIDSATGLPVDAGFDFMVMGFL